jgi:rubrerythrin
MTDSNSFSPFLTEILSAPSRHYHWLKSLSYLEYIGYRKMVKAVPYSEVNQGVYHHLNDEIQHSFMLRELAEKSLGENSLTSEALKAMTQIAEDYFQGIDARAHRDVVEVLGTENPYLCYLGVSYAVEKRAMKVYPHYFSKLSQPSLKHVVQKIIKDESEHLSYLEGIINRFPPIEFLRDTSFLKAEEEHFNRYLEAMNQFFYQFGI